MSPATLALIVQGIQVAIQAAPEVEAVALKGKELITELFTAKKISIEQQAAVHAHVDAVAAAVASGQTPPEFTVEPDPA